MWKCGKTTLLLPTLKKKYIYIYILITQNQMWSSQPYIFILFLLITFICVHWLKDFMKQSEKILEQMEKGECEIWIPGILREHVYEPPTV